MKKFESFLNKYLNRNDKKENVKSIQDKEKLETFKRELETRYGSEFVMAALGKSPEKTLVTTPVGINYEIYIRDFVRNHPEEADRLSKLYSDSHEGRPHFLIEKARSQIEYLNSNKNVTQAEDTSEEHRIYRDKDGYPNITLDPAFYYFFNSKTEPEFMREFSRQYPFKASQYRVGLQNKEKWQIKGHPSEKLNEIFNELGIDTSVVLFQEYRYDIPTIAFAKKESDGKKKIRVYRGVASPDQSILNQIPYASRGGISHDVNGNQYVSEILEIPEVSGIVKELANNPSIKVLLEYYSSVIGKIPDKSKKYLNEILLNFLDEFSDGKSVSDLLLLEHKLKGGITPEFSISPYISASTDITEAFGYTKSTNPSEGQEFKNGGFIVYDIPEDEVTLSEQGSECMIHGSVDPKYITYFVYIPTGNVDFNIVEDQMRRVSTEPLYSKDEYEEIKARRSQKLQELKGDEKRREDLEYVVKLRELIEANS